MPQQNVDIDQFLVGRFISQHMVDGRYDGTVIPGVTWQGQITDPAAAASALKASPWGQQQLAQIQAGVGFETPTSINGGTLSFGRTDNNDLLPALAALAPGVPIATGSSLLSLIAKALPSGALDSLPSFSGTDPSWGVNPQATGSLEDYYAAEDAANMAQGDAILKGNGTTYDQFLKSLGPGAAAAAIARGTTAGNGDFGSTKPGDKVYDVNGNEIDTGGSYKGMSLADLLKSGGDAASVLKLLGGGSGSSGAGAAIARILSGEGTAADYASIAGGLGSAGLGAYAADKQASTLKELADSQRAAEAARYEDLTRRESERYADLKAREDAAIGRQQGQIAADKAVVAPSQARYEGSFAPGFSMASDPGYQDALDQTAKATLHGLSVNGNPAGSPNAWAQSLQDIYEKTAYPALKDYRATNAATGYSGPFATGAATVPGIGSSLPGSTAVGSTTGSQVGSDTSAAAIGAGSNVFGAIGKGIANLTTPAQSFSLADLAKLYGGGNNVFAYGT